MANTSARDWTSSILGTIEAACEGFSLAEDGAILWCLRSILHRCDSMRVWPNRQRFRLHGTLVEALHERDHWSHLPFRFVQSRAARATTATFRLGTAA
jgi:hypothetical protein